MLPLILILAAILLFWVVTSLRSNGGTKDIPRDSSYDAAFLSSFAASTSYDDPPRHDAHHPHASGDAAPDPHASSPTPHASHDDSGSFDGGSHHSH